MTKVTNQISRLGLSASVGAVAFGMMFGATPAMAQVAATPAASADSTSDENMIVVTGSRIARRDLTAASPISIVPQEEFKLSGAVNVENVLNNLPQVIPGITAFSNNPGGGVSTLNLRNLGSTRTLVLVNGRRYMFFDTSQRVDLNTIPAFLLDGVDVVTGGASAVYGSDAIAGVVNFRLRNNLVGVEVGSQVNLTERGDGKRFDTHVALGTDFADGRGHITAYAEYYKRNPIYQDARGFSRVALADGATGLVFGGNATVPQGRLIATTGGAGTNYGTTLGAFFATPGTSRPYVSNAVDGYNIDPANLLMVPQERWLTGAYGEYEISDAVKAYMEFSFANNRVANQLAATPVTGLFNINIANNTKYLSAADVAQLRTIDAQQGGTGNTIGDGVVRLDVRRRILETGGRVSNDERNAFRTLVGLKGDITERFSYDAYYSYSRTRNANVQLGNISRSGFTSALLAGNLNIFGANTITADQLGAISILAQNNDISVLQVASANVTGSLFNLGLGGDDVAIVVGGEYRSMHSEFIPDTALSSGDVIGFNAGDPTSGRYSVKEIYGELNVPIVADQPLFYRLDLHGAARYSDYSLDAVGGVYTYAGDVKWSPIKDITFRGNYQRAIRAPNVGELFGGQSQGFPAASDPCGTAGALAAGALRDTCIATNVPASVLVNAASQAGLRSYTQIQGLFGGNPNLGEETSDSYSFGVIVQPTFIPRLNVQLDFFHIKVKDAIATAGGGVASILNLCYNVIQSASSPLCQLVARNPANGQIDGSVGPNGTSYVVSATNANIASLKTEGVDLTVDYSVPLAFGLLGEESKLNLFFLGTYTKADDTEPSPGLDTIKCAGKFGAQCGNPHPKYKWTTRLSWQDSALTTSFRWRHLSGVRDDDDGTDYVVEKLKGYDLYDVTLSYSVNDNLDFTFGVNNLFDKKPPVIGSNQEQANTYPGTYDVLGRDYFVSANFKF